MSYVTQAHKETQKKEFSVYSVYGDMNGKIKCEPR